MWREDGDVAQQLVPVADPPAPPEAAPRPDRQWSDGPDDDPEEGAEWLGLGAFWRSPPDQPAWARPSLLAVAAMAGLAYGWAWASEPPEPFYAAAARAMSANPRNFFFGAFDQWGTITVDKLPGALWVDALSVRIFGFHLWSVQLPHVLEGVLCILVLFRAVRRLAGPTAAIVAAALLAASPITVLLDRGNIPDSLLTLLLLLAVDATGRAVAGGGRRDLVVAGAWVGLGFLVKMTEAWLLLPALFAVYLVAGPHPSLGRRLRHCVAAGVAALAVSFSWVLVVASWPASHRPYLDGTDDNSVFTQIFVYNGTEHLGFLRGLGRAVGPSQPFLRLFAHNSPVAQTNLAQRPGVVRLLAGRFGDDGAWLLPAAAVSFIAVTVNRWRQPRTDRWRAACLLFAAWLVIDLLFLSTASYLNSYYVALTAPAVAGLCGLGLSLALTRVRAGAAAARRWLALAVGLTTAYAIYLVPSSAWAGRWLVPAVAGLAVVSLILLVPPAGRTAEAVGTVLGALACVLVPVVACVTVVVAGLGPFDAPFEPPAIVGASQSYRAEFHKLGLEIQAYPRFGRPRSGEVLGIDSSTEAEVYAMMTGLEILPIGGYNGSAPEPTLAALRRWIAAGTVTDFILPTLPTPTDPRVLWLEHHCAPTAPQGRYPVVFEYYHCGPGAGG